MCGPMKKHEVDTRSRDSNSGPQDSEANTVPHDHGHHYNEMKMPNLWNQNKLLQRIMECRCLIHKMLQKAEVEITECYEMIHKLI